MYRQCNIWMPCKGTRRLDRDTCVFYQQCQQFLVWWNIRSETKAIIEMQCMIFRKRSYLIPWNFYQMIPRTEQGWYQSEIFMTSYLHFSWVSTDQRRWAPNQITINTYFERGFQGTGLCDRLSSVLLDSLLLWAILMTTNMALESMMLMNTLKSNHSSNHISFVSTPWPH